METKENGQSKKIEGKVVATAKSLRDYMGKIQLGVRLEVMGVENWYNLEGKTDALEAVRTSGILARGNIVSCELDPAGKILSGLTLVSEAPKFSSSAGGEQGDDEINLETLLDAAHKMGLVGIATELLEFDLTNADGRKYAVFRATVTMPTKMINSVTGEPVMANFVGHGEVLEENIKAKPGDKFDMVPHLLRFAETRAICRALRWATNNAQAAEEEKQGGAEA